MKLGYYHLIFLTISSAASATVVIFSAPSSSKAISNYSSKAIIISTVSKESAPKSTNLDSALTSSKS